MRHRIDDIGDAFGFVLSQSTCSRNGESHIGGVDAFDGEESASESRRRFVVSARNKIHE